MTTEHTNTDQAASPLGSASSEGLGLYPERDHAAQGEHYLRHIDAMTREGLHAKSRIAGELAARDIEIERLNAQRRELQAERERLLDSLARAGLEASRMVRQERHEIAQWLDGQGQPGYAHDVRCRA